MSKPITNFIANYPLHPVANPTYKTTLEALLSFIENAKKLVVVTGAGISTDSGIPDYRSPGKVPPNPITHNQFVSAEEYRKRFWTRSYIGYLPFSTASPNISHYVLQELEKEGKLHHMITQNVDGLHRKAGTSKLTELHGNLHHVRCLNCDHKLTRMDMQRKIEELNGEILSLKDREKLHQQSVKPDGDVEMGNFDYNLLRIPECDNCSVGTLMPEVVFMGGTVPTHISEAATRAVEEGDSLLVVGSTLTVYSSYRLAKLAKSKNIPLAIVNRGLTRADSFADIKIEDSIADTLSTCYKLLKKQ